MRDEPPSARPPGGPPQPVRPQRVEPKRLTSARAMAEPAAVAPDRPKDIEEARLEVGDRRWVVRVTGRSVAAGGARVPMLLLGFWAETAETGDPEREALVVGRTLDALSECDLERAFARSRPPRPQVDRERESGRNGRRGRRGGAGRRREP